MADGPGPYELLRRAGGASITTVIEGSRSAPRRRVDVGDEVQASGTHGNVKEGHHGRVTSLVDPISRRDKKFITVAFCQRPDSPKVKRIDMPFDGIRPVRK